MATAKAIASSNLSLPLSSYIYTVISTAPRQDPLTYSTLDQLAIIASDDSLRFINPGTLSLLPDGIVRNVNESVTCLERANDEPSNVVVTAGRDGLVRFWDRRTRGRAMEIVCPHKLISALTCNTPQNFLAAGVENPEDGPHESPVYIWDQRNPTTPILTLADSHTDTLTTLTQHPSHPTLLLTSSTSGLLSVFDISQPNEDDALHQIINHGSAVARAGFMWPGTDIWACGTDETVAFYALQSGDEEVTEPLPRNWGDVREGVDGEYVVGVGWVGGAGALVVGKHSESQLDLIPIEKGGDGPLDWKYDVSKRTRFPGAHGGEIVRDVLTDGNTHTTYTVGEDGFIRSWKLPFSQENMDIDEFAVVEQTQKDRRKETQGRDRKEKRKEKKREKEKGKDEGRYKPY